MRIKMAMSTFLNGEHAINEAHRSNGRKFQQLVGYVKPKFIKMGEQIAP